MKNEPIAAVAGTTLLFSGEALDQGDLDVWMAVIHSARRQPADQPVVLRRIELVRRTGLKPSSTNYERMLERLDRLMSAKVRLEFGLKGERKTYIGHMLEGTIADEKTEAYALRINKDMARLFDPGCYNQVHFGIRKQLPAFAKWLHAYYSSHQAPLPVHVDYLRGLSNSADSARRSFRQTLVKALYAIHEASAKLGHSFHFGLDVHDRVHVQQAPTPKAGIRYLSGTLC